MDIKKLIVIQIYRLKLINKQNIDNMRQLQSIIMNSRYKIILNTNYNLDIEYIIRQLSMEHLCGLFTDGYVNFIIKDSNIEYYADDILAIYLLNFKHNINYMNIYLD